MGTESIFTTKQIAAKLQKLNMLIVEGNNTFKFRLVPEEQLRKPLAYFNTHEEINAYLDDLIAATEISDLSF